MSSAFHLAVLGDHLGGLAAAALAARRGLRVLLLETQEAGAERRFELLNAVTGSPEQEPTLGRLFQEIGLAPFGPLGDDRIHFRALAPSLQVCGAHRRFTCHPDRTARLFELQREFGDEHRALAALLQREEEYRGRLERALPPGRGRGGSLAARAIAGLSGLVRLRSLEREAARQGFPELLGEARLGPALAAAVAAQAQAVARRPVADLTWAEGLRALRIGQSGLYRNAAAQSGVLAGLRAVFLARGGDARPLIALEALETPRSGGVRLHLAAGGAVRADRAVVDLPLPEALRLLPAEAVRAADRRGIRESEECGYGLLEFAIAAERRPDLMGEYLAILPPEDRPGDPAVLLAGEPRADAQAGGRCRMEAVALFPGGAAAGREHIEQRVEVVMPFFRESLVGEAVYRTGSAGRPLRERMGRAQREARLSAGRRTALFVQPPFTFLRNGDYAAVGLAEGLCSGLLAVS